MKTILPRSSGGLLPTPMPRIRRHVDHLLAAAAAFGSRRRLADLPAHLLEDVGLTREEAVAEASRPFWDVPPQWRRPGS